MDANYLSRAVKPVVYPVAEPACSAPPRPTRNCRRLVTRSTRCFRLAKVSIPKRVPSGSSTAISSKPKLKDVPEHVTPLLRVLCRCQPPCQLSATSRFVSILDIQLGRDGGRELSLVCKRDNRSGKKTHWSAGFVENPRQGAGIVAYLMPQHFHVSCDKFEDRS